MLDAIQALLAWEFLPWSVLGILAMGWLLEQAGKRVANDLIQNFKENFAMVDWPHSVALLIILIWGGLFGLLLFGLGTVIVEFVFETPNPDLAGQDSIRANSEFKFLLTRVAALTAILGAVVALPFTALRLKEMRKTNLHNADVLFNDKLHEANTDLHARYQVTERDGEGPLKDIWKDDIIKRNGAIDRLEALANERPETAPRIGRMLSVYLKEMSKEHKPLPYDKSWYVEEIYTWQEELKARKRSDMGNAAQVLGRLRGIKDDLKIDLAEVNLQAMRLSDLDFDTADFDNASFDGAELNWAALNGAELNGAELNGAKLNGAKLNEAELNEAELNGAKLNEAELNRAELFGAVLNGAKLNRAKLNEAELNGAKLNGAELNGAELNGAKLNGAVLNWAVLNWAELDEKTDLRAVQATGSALRFVDLKEVKNLQNLLEGSFGDGTVELPEGAPWPKKWPKHELASFEFQMEWKKFKADPEGYVPPEA